MLSLDHTPCEIALTKGQSTTVCRHDYGWLSRHKWCVSTKGYAVRRRPGGGMIWMHREVNSTPTGTITDHIDRTKLNNLCTNLCNATHSSNGHNTDLLPSNTHGHKGIYQQKQNGNWYARIIVQRKVIHLGVFDTKEVAIIAREVAEKEYL